MHKQPAAALHWHPSPKQAPHDEKLRLLAPPRQPTHSASLIPRQASRRAASGQMCCSIGFGVKGLKSSNASQHPSPEQAAHDGLHVQLGEVHIGLPAADKHDGRAGAVHHGQRRAHLPPKPSALPNLCLCRPSLVHCFRGRMRRRFACHFVCTHTTGATPLLSHTDVCRSRHRTSGRLAGDCVLLATVHHGMPCSQARCARKGAARLVIDGVELGEQDAVNGVRLRLRHVHCLPQDSPYIQSMPSSKHKITHVSTQRQFPYGSNAALGQA